MAQALIPHARHKNDIAVFLCSMCCMKVFARMGKETAIAKGSVLPKVNWCHHFYKGFRRQERVFAMNEKRTRPAAGYEAD